MIRIFEKAVRRLLAEKPTGRILLAVSGGVDSMTMADLFRRSVWAGRCAVAHVNFSLRGEESDADEALVRQWAEQASLPFYSKRFDTGAYAQQQAISTQMAARELRYGWFEELMREEGFDWLAVAHHQDDGVETLFLNLLRGTGFRGLLGIRPLNGKIVRPLLDVSRREILDYARTFGVPYRDDRTNAESHYARNRLRNIVFPELEKINPSFKQTVARNISYFSQAQALLDARVAEVRSAVVADKGSCVEICVEALQNDPHRDFLCHEILSEYGFNASQVAGLVGAMGGESGKQFYSRTHELLTAGSVWRVYPLLTTEQQEILSIAGPGEYVFQGRRFRLSIGPRDGVFSPEGAPDRLCFDADLVQFPLCCRTWRPADRFRPYGMRQGSKKLSDFFVDLKMDLRQKSEQPVLTAWFTEEGTEQERIVLLPGLRLDDRFRVTDKTKNIGEVVVFP